MGDWGVILQSQDFLRPQLQLVPKLVGFDLVVPPSELGRQYRIEAATVPTFAMPSTVLTYSGAYTNIVFRDDATNASRYYRVVSP